MTTAEVSPQQQKFIKLANTRVPRAIKALGSVQALAKYKPADAHIQQIIDAIGTAYVAMKDAFDNTQKDSKKSFSLK